MKHTQHQKLVYHFDYLVRSHGIANDLDCIQFREHLTSVLKIKTDFAVSKMALVIKFAQIQDYLDKMPNLTISDVEHIAEKSDADLGYLYNALKIDPKLSIYHIYDVFMRTVENLQQGCETTFCETRYASLDDFVGFRYENERIFNSPLRRFRRNYCSRQRSNYRTGECEAFSFLDSSIIVLSELSGDSVQKRIDSLALATVKLVDGEDIVEHSYFLTLNDQLTFRFDDQFSLWLEPEISICCLFPETPCLESKNDQVSTQNQQQYVQKYKLVAVLGALCLNTESFRVFDLREIHLERMYQQMAWPVLAYYKRVVHSESE